MQKTLGKIASIFLWVLALMAITLSFFVIVFIFLEAIPFFTVVDIKYFFFGTQWFPTDIFETQMFGAFNFIIASIVVSSFAILLALIVSTGSAIFIVMYTSKQIQAFLLSIIDLLAAIPSVVYGFLGIVIIVKAFLSLGLQQGNCVFTASIVLAIMLLPYMISTITESLTKKKLLVMNDAKALGVSAWYTMFSIVLPSSAKGIIVALIMALGRAMGETMAVMMLIGNANVFPTLFGKGQSIAAVIALEMGTAVHSSMHYHGLYALGTVLLALIFIINMILSRLKEKI